MDNITINITEEPQIVEIQVTGTRGPKGDKGDPGDTVAGPKYLRGDATTINSVRIGISGTDVTLQKYDGAVWNDITVIGGPI